MFLVFLHSKMVTYILGDVTGTKLYANRECPGNLDGIVGDTLVLV